MKRINAILLTLALAISMSACDLSYLTELAHRDSKTKPTETTNSTAATDSSTDPAEVTNPTAPTAGFIDPTVPTEPTLSAELPYKQKIKRADHPIYNGPGYDYYQTGTVEESGTYTIVEEQTDDEGNLWGKLKSGAGWVDLTQIRKENDNAPLITVSIPSQALLQSGLFHHCVADDSEYMVQAALRIREPVTNVAIYDVVFDGDNESLQELFTLESWNADMPIVADVTFPGAASSYEIHFTDASGKQHRYTLYESGRNGEIGIDAWSILD